MSPRRASPSSIHGLLRLGPLRLSFSCTRSYGTSSIRKHISSLRPKGPAVGSPHAGAKVKSFIVAFVLGMWKSLYVLWWPLPAKRHARTSRPDVTDEIIADEAPLAGLHDKNAEERVRRGHVLEVALTADENLAGRRAQRTPPPDRPVPALLAPDDADRARGPRAERERAGRSGPNTSAPMPASTAVTRMLSRRATSFGRRCAADDGREVLAKTGREPREALGHAGARIACEEMGPDALRLVRREFACPPRDEGLELHRVSAMVIAPLLDAALQVREARWRITRTLPAVTFKACPISSASRSGERSPETAFLRASEPAQAPLLRRARSTWGIEGS